MNDNTRDILSLLVCDLSTDVLDIYGRIVANLADIVPFCDLIYYVDRYSQIFICEYRSSIFKSENVVEFLTYSHAYRNIRTLLYRM